MVWAPGSVSIVASFPRRRCREDVDHAGIADGDIQLLALPVEESHVGLAAQWQPTQDFSRAGIEREQHAGIAGAEQPVRRLVEIETVRPGGGNGEHVGEPVGLSSHR